ncbi:MAG: carboxypeptidase-like regulatory domain-containing protein, partial [Crocinitomicaceae bacterium]|nr:carboxypeptidase-like regulatory domain-containing protein [Crocinitomicaceae bacterium]
MRFTLTLSSLLLIISCQYALSQDYTIRGFIYEKANGEPMAFEKVKLLSASDSAIVSGGLTDVNGFFSISKVSKGKYILKVENFSYNTITRNVEVAVEKGILDLKFELEKSTGVKEFDEVNVSADSKIKKNEVQISQLKLDKKGLERIPSVGAENDIVGAFSVTPGVVTTGDQGGQL